MLVRAAEKRRTDSSDDRVNNEREDCAGNHRQERVRQANKHSDQRAKKFPGEVSGKIPSDERAEPRDLSRQTAPPTAENFKQDQNERERNEHDLPKRRTGGGLKLRVHSLLLIAR